MNTYFWDRRPRWGPDRLKLLPFSSRLHFFQCLHMRNCIITTPKEIKYQVEPL